MNLFQIMNEGSQLLASFEDSYTYFTRTTTFVAMDTVLEYLSFVIFFLHCLGKFFIFVLFLQIHL